MYLLLIQALAAMSWLAIRTRNRHWRSWFDAALAGCVFGISLGTFSTSTGLVLTLQATAKADPSAKSATLSHGLSISYRPLTLALIACLLTLFVAAVFQWRTAPTPSDEMERPQRYTLQWMATLFLFAMASVPVLWLGGAHLSFSAAAVTGSTPDAL